MSKKIATGVKIIIAILLAIPIYPFMVLPFTLFGLLPIMGLLLGVVGLYQYSIDDKEYKDTLSMSACWIGMIIFPFRFCYYLIWKPEELKSS